MTHDVSALTGIGANKLCRTICTRLGNEKIALLSQPVLFRSAFSRPHPGKSAAWFLPLATCGLLPGLQSPIEEGASQWKMDQLSNLSCSKLR
jgi:hypothetical protein